MYQDLPHVDLPEDEDVFAGIERIPSIDGSRVITLFRPNSFSISNH
jgi:hypothetical protein